MTITGPSGVGKTRFAAAVAAELGDVDGVTLRTAEQPLGTPDEHPYRLRPLAEAPAVELFRQRAEARDPGFDAPYAAIARVCRRIGRLPLAIELAAARAPQALAELGDRPWTLPEVVEWTCAGLGRREREVLRALAREPATADGDSVADEVAALAALSLVDRSDTGVTLHPAVDSVARCL